MGYEALRFVARAFIFTNYFIFRENYIIYNGSRVHLLLFFMKGVILMIGEILVLFVACFVTYIVTLILLKHRKKIGYLRVDHSDPSEPAYLFLELDNPPDKLKNGDEVLLIVKMEDYISQK